MRAILRSPILLVLVALSAIKLGAVLWALPRGFEIADEGAFLLILGRPEQAPAGFEFFRLFSLLPLHLDLVTWRLVRVATEVAAFLALAAGLARWLPASVFRDGGSQVHFVLAFAALAIFLGAGSRGFSYNDVTNLCSFATTACLLAAWSDELSRRRATLLLVAMGVSTGIGVLAKFPSALGLAALVSLHLLVFPLRVPGLRRPTSLALFWTAALGIILPALLVVNGGVEGVIARFEEAALHKRLLGYDVTDILASYLAHDFLSFRNLGFLVAAFVVSRMILGPSIGRLPSLRGDSCWSLPLALASAALAYGAWTHHPPFVHPVQVGLFCLVPFLVVVLGVGAFRSSSPGMLGESRRGSDFALVALLAAVPWMNVAGTNVALTLRLPAHVLPMYAAIAVLLGELVRRTGARMLAPVVVALVAGLSIAVFWFQLFVRPYGLPAPILEQRFPVAALGGLRVDEPTATFLDDLQDAAEKGGWRRGERLVALDYMPGLVHFLGGVSPGTVLYSLYSPRFNCAFLNAGTESTPPWLLLARPPGEELSQCLTAFRFPEDFELVAALPNPWRYAYAFFHDVPVLPQLRLYAPRARTTSVPAPPPH